MRARARATRRYAPFFIVVGIEEPSNPTADLLVFNDNEARLVPHARVAYRFALTATMLTVGALALWPGLRVFVQARLSSQGEGVAAAAGISELLGSDDTAALIARATDTFRAVRADVLRPSDLDTNLPAAASYALSTKVPLGSVDMFLSHSWHDQPGEKCAPCARARACGVRTDWARDRCAS